MKKANSSEASKETIKSYGVNNTGLYFIGTFETGVTVLSQQVRALNFVWSALESKTIETDSGGPKKKVAIIGGGFAGLTVAAALLEKQANIQLTLFEKRDTLLPLQQGSDSRWLHPRIYEWPGHGSDASVAMLPILNWTAARASDVVVQILTKWKKTVDKSELPDPDLYCNARHLQIDRVNNGEKLQIEWVGERREARDGTVKKGSSSSGSSEQFDMVILATGFGLEKDGVLSYWRNETLGQPSLDQPVQTYMVSGQGDGAMIDLLRLCITQFRQDRILSELFEGQDEVLSSIKMLHKIHDNIPDLFARFELLESDTKTDKQFSTVLNNLNSRLRRDTTVILHLKVKKVSELFDSTSHRRMSFQNKLLVYFLYKCGGFTPSALDEEVLIDSHSISENCIIRRHGTLRDEQLSEMLSTELNGQFSQFIDKKKSLSPLQSDQIAWPGGYFGFPGTSANATALAESVKARWRKEYLPGPTELIATAFCSAVAGQILANHSDCARLRVTLHRALTFANGEEELLQQCCAYLGTDTEVENTSSAARTFPAKNATIGLAYQCRKVIRTIKTLSKDELDSTMGSLKLAEASRRMASEVGFILAIPLLQPEEKNKFTMKSPVAGVLYIDSTASGFYIEDGELVVIVRMIQEFLNTMEISGNMTHDRIRNVSLTGMGTNVPNALDMPPQHKKTFEMLIHISPPKSTSAFQLNFDYSDFLSTGGASV